LAKQRYKDVKHPDKFHEGLSAAWAVVEPYALPVGIAVFVLLIVAGIWVVVARQWAARRDAPWAKDFEIHRRANDAAAEAETNEDLEKAAQQALADIDALAREYQRRPVAAVALIKLSRGHFGLGHRSRTRDPKSASEHFKKAAEAAEQFLADFPDHGLHAIAAYNGGRARLELGEHQRAAEHFERAQTSAVSSLAAIAQWHAARCYEHLGRTDSARRAYQALRNNPWAGWCAQQAEWRLSQLESRPAKGT
jgi:tetratricopeptide (TPR) repeat protein